MGSVWRDARVGARRLLRAPAFTMVAVATLALGIGANTAVFSVINAALLRPWPGVREPGALVWISHSNRGRTQRLSYPDLADYRDRVAQLESLAGYDRLAVNLSSETWSERETAQVVTAGYFELLGVRPALGRLIGAGDGDRAAVAVLSHGCWQRRFGSDPGIVGRAITANGVRLEVIGVATPGFAGTEMEDRPAFWAPVGALRTSWLESRDSSWLSVLARLRRGTGTGEAAAAVGAVCAANTPLRAEDLRAVRAELSRVRGWVPPGQVGDVAPPAVLGMAVTGLVLLIAGANFANLLLVRVSGRHRELAVRAALGASAGRIRRLLLTEAVLLAVVGGAVGLLLAAWATPVLAAAVGAPENLRPMVDVTVAAYALVVALVVGVFSASHRREAPAAAASSSRSRRMPVAAAHPSAVGASTPPSSPARSRSLWCFWWWRRCCCAAWRAPRRSSSGSTAGAARRS